MKVGRRLLPEVVDQLCERPVELRARLDTAFQRYRRTTDIPHIMEPVGQGLSPGRTT